MPRIRVRAPAISRTERLRRQQNYSRDMAALSRLEQIMNQPPPRNDDQMADFDHRHSYFDDRDHPASEFPGFEDSEDEADHKSENSWVCLTDQEEETNAIDIMVRECNEHHRQRTREFNWDQLLRHLHPIYMIQKILTKDWAGPNTYEEFPTQCTCVPESRLRRSVDLVDIYGQRRTKITFCQCTQDAIRLLRLGYLAGSPVRPQTAFSAPLLIFHNSLWNFCHVGALPFTMALNHFLEPRSQRLCVRNGQHARELRKPFTAAVDLYRRLEEISESMIYSGVLRSSEQEVLASLCCPACFGPQPLESSIYPETTRDRLVVCLDGNFQHRHHTLASRNHESLRTPRIFLDPQEVTRSAELILQAELQDGTPEQIHRCTESHKAADDKRNESTWKGCDDTGLMGCCCRHDAAIYLANIHKSGEQRCFPLALIKRLLSTIEPGRRIGILYDIGCSMDKFINLRRLLPDDRARMKFGTSVFHAYVHDWSCQLDYHPRFNHGWGLSDGEGLERLWSFLSPLVSPLRYATRNHRLGSIAHRLAHHNRQSIAQLPYWLRQKFLKALSRRGEAQKSLATLLAKTNPHSRVGRNYTRSFFLRQWAAQRSFQADHTSVEELRMRKMVAIYERKNVIELMRSRLHNPRIFQASAAEVRRLMDSIESETEKLQEDMEALAGELPPAENVRERKLRLLIWSSKSDLFLQAVHLRAERQPLVDARNTGSRLGTKLKEKVFKAINAQKPAIVNLIGIYNDRFAEYRQHYPGQLAHEESAQEPLTYEKLSVMPLDDTFWNDGMFYHSDAPWAIDPDVREGIHCSLVLGRVQEEFDLIAQELVRLMAWAIKFHTLLVDNLTYLRNRISQLRSPGSSEPRDHIDEIEMPNVSRRTKAKVIKSELSNRLLAHNDLVNRWSVDVTWVWDHCQPRQNRHYFDNWKELMETIKQEPLPPLANPDDLDEDLEDIACEEVLNDGEDAQDDWITTTGPEDDIIGADGLVVDGEAYDA